MHNVKLIKRFVCLSIALLVLGAGDSGPKRTIKASAISIHMTPEKYSEDDLPLGVKLCELDKLLQDSVDEAFRKHKLRVENWPISVEVYRNEASSNIVCSISHRNFGERTAVVSYFNTNCMIILCEKKAAFPR